MPDPALVLVVEDDQDIRESIAETLEEEGFSVVTAAHGGIAMENLRRAARRPSLILLDLMMPVMNGWEFCAELRKDGANSEIPIVVLSGDARVSDHASSLGAIDVLAKPITLAQLLDVVKRYCSAER
jgi:CheY-like chemotaxis protein